MKLYKQVVEVMPLASLPTRERGLKLDICAVWDYPDVAPHAGAWIETHFAEDISLDIVVAPHAGAWIETLIMCTRPFRLKSLPTRERGLKLSIPLIWLHHSLSLPTRERGLKRRDGQDEQCTWGLLPTRERGLKHRAALIHHLLRVAPHAGAWIETIVLSYIDPFGQSLPTRERGLKHQTDDSGKAVARRSPRGSVD